MIVASEEVVRSRGLRPLAAVTGCVSVGLDPAEMGLGPVPALRALERKVGWGPHQADLVELNEAFAAQLLACDRELRLDRERLNVNGGAIALGHPLGCTGARLLTSILHELERRKGRYGLVTLCIGMGQGMATIIERVS